MTASGFLADPPPSDGARRLCDDDTTDVGFVMNGSRLWGHQPDTHDALFDLMRHSIAAQDLSMRERGILITACASTLGDAYCSLAWGAKLSEVAGDGLAAGVLSGDDSALTDAERAMARWARTVTRDPNGTRDADVQALRDVGFDDARIFAITVYVALRLAFATVNDALGARPDREFLTRAPEAVRNAVTWGRPIAG
jgi:uncharacterized peroxidase-related enzyme